MLTKRIPFVFLLFLIAFTTTAQRKIKKVEVEEIGFNVKLKFIPQTDEQQLNNLQFKIIPISASDLNSKFLSESNFNGKFEYSHYEKSRTSYFLKKRKRKIEKTDFEFLLEGAEWLYDNEKINNEEYDELVKQIILHYDYDSGKELYSTNRIMSSNPYYVGDKYLNTFKIEVTNDSDSFQEFGQKVLVETRNQILQPLSSSQIMNELDRCGLMNLNKSQILERYNLSGCDLIPPKSKFEKYFAVLPIDYNTKDLSISIEGLNTKFNWSIEKDHETINAEYVYYEISVEWVYDNFTSVSQNNFTMLNNASSNIYLANNALFIGEENLNDEFEVIALTLYSEKLFFARVQIKGSEYIDKEKNRRRSVTIKTEKLDELTKKVKL